MMWHYYGAGGGEWWWMAGMMLLFWGAVAALVLLAVRAWHNGSETRDQAIETLRERFAKGEITKEQFEEAAKTLRARP